MAEPRVTPRSVCILRLSAIGDVCHALPVVRTLQRHWPDSRFTWIIGKTEHALLGDIPDIQFIVFDKKRGWRAYRDLRNTVSGQHFDLLLHMQTSLRGNIAAALVPAATKLGYDKARSRELHGWVINKRIEPGKNAHQIDDMFGFAEALGVRERILEWNIPIPDSAEQFARTTLPKNSPVLAINACSSPSKRVHRNWHPRGYAEVANYAAEKLGFAIVLCGGPTEQEKNAAAAIIGDMRVPVIDLVGKTSLKQLVAVLKHSSVLLTSDSGPAHLATAVGTPVVALHAVTNPFQTGPYLSLANVVNKYPEAVLEEYGKRLEDLAWGIRVHSPDAMNRIKPQEVIAQLEKLSISRSTSPDTA